MKLAKKILQRMALCLGWAWASPCTLLALLVSLVYRPSNPRLVNGMVLVDVARVFPSWASAQTIGTVAFATSRASERTVRHETLGHGRQFMTLGAFMVILYPLSLLVAWAVGKDWYRDSYFEVLAQVASDGP